jgi:hypothetical protein
VLAFPTVAATEEIKGFTFFPFLTIAHAACAVIFGQVLASWNPKKLRATAAQLTLIIRKL